MKRLKSNLCCAGGAAGFGVLFLVIFLPVWFLVIDVDEEAPIEEAPIEECAADGFDYYKYIDCMPEMRNELIEGSYNETACLA